MIPVIPSQTHHWLAQQRVHPNADLAKVLPEELARIGARRVFLLTTPALAASEVLERVRMALGDTLCAVFDKIEAHTPAEQVAEAAKACAASGAELVVAVGGGSVVDASKMLCYATWHGLHSREALLGQLPRGLQGSEWSGAAPTLRSIAIPTTLSAAEFTTHAGITDTERGKKHVVLHPWMIPQVAILDPKATLQTPPRLLLGSAIRAVDHAVERWCSVRPAPFSDAVSQQAMGMLAAALPAIHRDPRDLAARAAAQYAAWLSIMGGWADVPVGASHGLGYILGAYKGVPHGETSCVMLPAVLKWNEPVNRERQSRVATLFGHARSASQALRGFIDSLELPTSLHQVGIGPDAFHEIAAQFDGTGPIATNPRPVRDAADLVEILKLAR